MESGICEFNRLISESGELESILDDPNSLCFSPRIFRLGVGFDTLKARIGFARPDPLLSIRPAAFAETNERNLVRKFKVLFSRCSPAVEVTRMPGMAQSSTLLPVMVMLRCAPAGAMLPLPPVASTRMATPAAVPNRIAGDDDVAAAPGLQPPVFRRHENGRHFATFQVVAADFAVTGLDQNAARPVETEIAAFDRKAVADPIGRANHAAQRHAGFTVERDRICLSQRAPGFQAGVHALP